MILRSKYLSILVLICLFVPLLSNCAPRYGAFPTVTIAVVEADPGSAGNPNPQSAYAGVKLAVDQFKKYNGVNVRVDLYSDGNDQAQAAQIAEEIAQSNAIAVIGHSSIETSNVAGGIYDEYKLPVINVVPVTEHLTQDHPYHFNITYTAESEAAYLASYLVKLEDKTTAGIIHAADAENDALQKQFRNLFAKYGGVVTFREAATLSEPAGASVEPAPAEGEAGGPDEQVDVESEPQAVVPEIGLSESELSQLSGIIERLAAITDVDQPELLLILANDLVRSELAAMLKEKGISIPVSGAEIVEETFIRELLKPPTASIIYTEDGYGSALARQFRNTFTGLGGKITLDEVITVVDSRENRIEEIVSRIISADAETEDPGTIFIAADDVTAAQLIIAMKRKGVSYPKVGASTLSTPAFLETIAGESESTIPGYFTDGLLTTRALIFDSANRYANQFLEDYQNIYKGGQGRLIEPGDRAINGYEAALALIAAIQNSTVGGTDTTADRETLYKALLAMDDVDASVNGLISPIFFEPSRNILRAARFGVYQKGEIVSANVQFEPIAAPGEINDLQSQIERGRIMTVNGGYVYKANIVYAGVDILSIQEIDIKASTYKMDFYLWFRYRPNDRDADFKPDEFVFTNAESEPEKILVREEEFEDDGTVLKTYRISGVFKGQFRFHDYPFDRQNLIVEFRNQNAATSFIQYVVDRIGMRYESEAQLLDNLRANGAFDSTFGWRERGAQVTQDIFPTFSTFGSPQYFGRTVATNYSLIKVNVDIQRDSLQYILKSLLPLLITLILAYITFFLPLGHEERLAVGSTALLTTAFFHLTLADALPEIGYTVAMEFLFYASYVISALIVLLETLSIRLEKQAEEAKRKAEREQINAQRWKWNMTGRVIYPAFLLLALGVEYLVYSGTIQLVPKEAESKHLVEEIIEARQTTEARPPDANTGSVVNLTLSTWRTEDEAQIRILLDQFEAYARDRNMEIVVEHKPIVSVNYDSIMDIQLSREQGPDLFYVRPFSVDGNISKYLRRLNDDLPLTGNYDARSLVPWENRSGDYYAVPFVGVVQGVYYNRELFAEYGLRVPTTWNEFLRHLETIKRQDPQMIPIANALNQTEDSEMFMSLAANFLGGSAGRERLMQTDGTNLCYNDQQVVDVFRAVEMLKPYLPEDAATINSQTSKELFFSQKAVMLFGGSWDLKTVSEGAEFDWDVFALPGPVSNTYVIFQPDIGIGLNRDTAHYEEARLFLEWLMTEDAVNLTSENLAGFYPLNRNKPRESSDLDDMKFLNLVNSFPTDIRWTYTEISNQVPSALEIVRRDLYNMLTLNLTPEEAAQNLQNGLGEWYEPAQNCQ